MWRKLEDGIEVEDDDDEENSPVREESHNRLTLVSIKAIYIIIKYHKIYIFVMLWHLTIACFIDKCITPSHFPVSIPLLDHWVYSPSGLTVVRDVALRICRPPTIHLISAGGFDAAVVHVSGTISPTRASVDPDIETCVGATGKIKCKKKRRKSKINNTL